MFIALAVAFAASLAAALILPILRRPRPLKDVDPGGALAARLEDIRRAAAAGLIGEPEAAEAGIEAKRLALAGGEPRADARADRGLRFAAIAAAGLAPLAAAVIYLEVGAPDLARMGGQALAPASSAAEEVAAMAPAARDAMIRGMVDRLEARLKDNPEDAEGWRMLARSRAALGENAAAAGALRELLKRVAGDPEDWRNFAGALMSLGPGEGRETELKDAMDRLAALRPEDPLALYYFGSEALAAGDRETAAGFFERLLAQVPADAPARPAIEALLKDARGG
jgi:cytochrome c-type biogenesis protein CcmH